jgi:uncharacterized membrane protein HdeD (DUF308 family)
MSTLSSAKLDARMALLRRQVLRLIYGSQGARPPFGRTQQLVSDTTEPDRPLSSPFGVKHLFAVRTAVLARQERTAKRFRGPADWLRLAVLGVVLMSLATLALMDPVSGRKLPDYVPGISATFGGVMLCIAVIRIGWPTLYLDWIVSGLLYMGLGAILYRNSTAIPNEIFLLFCTVFLASAALRIWIAATLGAKDERRAWLMAGGLTGLFCAFWMIVMWLTEIAIDPDLVVCVDVMLYGLSIAGFGLSLREPGERGTSR